MIADFNLKKKIPQYTLGFFINTFIYQNQGLEFSSFFKRSYRPAIFNKWLYGVCFPYPKIDLRILLLVSSGSLTWPFPTPSNSGQQYSRWGKIYAL